MPGMRNSPAADSMQSDGGGLYVYLVTPYNAKGDVDTGVLAEYAAEILRAGVSGVTCIASTCAGSLTVTNEQDARRRVELARNQGPASAAEGDVAETSPAVVGE